MKNLATIAFPIQTADLHYWLREPMPVILVVYEIAVDTAYWLYVQAYFAKQPDFKLAEMGETFVVHLQKTDILNEQAIRDFAR